MLTWCTTGLAPIAIRMCPCFDNHIILQNN
jgi:hypothetical protein